MSIQLANDPHDFALWLLDNLQGVASVGNSSLWEGKLSNDVDFATVEDHLESLPGSLAGPCRVDTREIGFYPSHAHVYTSINDLLSQSNNRVRVPDRFTVRNIGYTYPSTEEQSPQPEVVTQYVNAVRLWTLLQDLADARNGGLLFVLRHDAQLTLMPEFRSEDLRTLVSFPRFAAEFANDTHGDQKRSIIRAILIELFRPQRSVRFSEVLGRFEEIATDAFSSLAMYTAEFSVAKIKAEVERQNLDDTLSLNKTLADIQNQLLALPAAILLAGATIKTGEELRNYAVLLGVIVFAIFVVTLVSNQRHSIDAIGIQIERRRAKVETMPAGSSASILPLFTKLEARVIRQKRVLTFIASVVWVVVSVTTVAVIYVNHAGGAEFMIGGAVELLRRLGGQ